MRPVQYVLIESSSLGPFTCSPRPQLPTAPSVTLFWPNNIQELQMSVLKFSMEKDVYVGKKLLLKNTMSKVATFKLLAAIYLFILW